MSEALVVDAYAWVDLLLGEAASRRVADRLATHSLHAPAHIDLQVLAAFGRLERSGRLSAAQIDERLQAASTATIRRHALAELAGGAWRRRAGLRISDAFYVELAAQLGVPLITTDLRLARATPHAEAI